MDKPDERARVLVVENESIVAREIAETLKALGHDPIGIADNAADAIAIAMAEVPDLIIMDIKIKGPVDGIDAALEIRKRASIPVIFLTAYSNKDMIHRARVAEPSGYLIKPLDDLELEIALEMALYRSRTEEIVQRQGRLLRSVLDALPHPLYVIDPADYKVILTNQASVNIGSSGSACHSLIHAIPSPCDDTIQKCPVREVMATGHSVMIEHSMRAKADDAEHDFEVYGYPLRDARGAIENVIVYAMDITERKRLERQFIESQKMESIGRLASGVAHDFSNILSAVLGYAEMAMLEMPENHPAYDKIEVICEAAERAAALTSKLLAFSSRQVLEIRSVEPAGIVTGVSRMLARIIGDNVDLVADTSEPVPNIMADGSQLEIVLMNMAVNARDAMPEGGTLRISLHKLEAGPEEAEAANIEEGTYTVFRVQDTGHGIPSELIHNIFEPFFTTKRQGEGTGLGLAAVYGIVKQHKGHVIVNSTVGKGTTFEVLIPAASEAAERTVARAKTGWPTGNETILVIDDEPIIRRLISDTLTPLGYRMIEAGSAEEVLEETDTLLEDIDLVITDVVMRGMNGIDLVKKLAAIKPEICALIMTGYTDEAARERDSGRRPCDTLMTKPIKPTVLARMVRETLEAGAKRRSGAL